MSTTRRMPMIDALKAVASQIVLLHHFSSYGPLAETARDLLPGLLGWLYDYGRMAVQVFLVVAGFLAARGLSPQGDALAASPLPLLWKRYQRLIIPFLAAIGIAIIGSAIADHWMDDDAIPARAGFAQWLAHATLLHGVLGVDSLSAGVWYVAIDFQLFALMALLLWAGRRAFVAPLLVLSVGAASLFWFNRNPDLDNWAIYFFGSYALGAAAWWASDPRRLSAWTGVIATVAIAALVVDFRLRIALALGVALLLAVGRRSGLLERWPDVAPLAFLGRISYSVFLVHFPILLLANGLFVQLGGETPGAAVFGLLAAWTVSLLAATAFYRWIEGPEASRRIADGLGSLFARAREMRRLVPRRLRRLLGA
ncbi:MAG: acyltransferase [Dechloromonas sp.]|jgi:peptidoglycan/LPS O-acetylase OafA/YrhL|uniref:acyltransferase family protein n=1 Tax=Azonexus sp. TaxID=1872668 RepID=UPI0035B351F0|nr:acyltransferase [Dechloromonas sp.]